MEKPILPPTRYDIFTLPEICIKTAKKPVFLKCKGTIMELKPSIHEAVDSGLEADISAAPKTGNDKVIKIAE